MSTTFFKHEIAPVDHNYPPKVQAIHRTPGNERLVTADDIAQPLAGDTETKRTQPASGNGKPRLCLLKCGRLAAKADRYCEQCRSESDQSRRHQ